MKKNGECCIGDLGLAIRYDPIQGQIDTPDYNADKIRVGTKQRSHIYQEYFKDHSYRSVFKHQFFKPNFCFFLHSFVTPIFDLNLKFCCKKQPFWCKKLV